MGVTLKSYFPHGPSLQVLKSPKSCGTSHKSNKWQKGGDAPSSECRRGSIEGTVLVYNAVLSAAITLFPV